jgi:hypothetical protein
MSEQVDVKYRMNFSGNVKLIGVRVDLLYNFVLPVQPVEFLGRSCCFHISEVQKHPVSPLILGRCCSCFVSLVLLFFLCHCDRGLGPFSCVMESLKEAFCQCFAIFLWSVLNSSFLYKLNRLVVVSVHEKEGAQASR